MLDSTSGHDHDQDIQLETQEVQAPASPPSPMAHLSVFRSLYDTATERSGAFPWDAIVPKFTNGHLHTATKEAAPLYSFARFRPGGTCCNADVIDLSVFVMDIDGGTAVEDIKAKLAGYEYILYSTYNYTPKLPKIRVLMPMTRLVTADEWLKLWLAVDQWLGNGVLDASTKNVGRRYWFPSCPEENRHWAFAVHNSGKLLDPDEFLSSPPPSFSSPQPLSQAAVKELNASILGGLPKLRPNMTKGYPDGKRTGELLIRAGWCLGPDKMSEDEALAACLAWNQYNTPPLDEEKIISTVRSIAKTEAKKAAQAATAGQVSLGAAIPEVAALPTEAAARIAELAQLSKFDYDRCRAKEAEALGVRVLTLDDLVAECRPRNPEEDNKSGKPLSLPSPEPWPEAVDGADLLDQIVTEILRYVVLPDGAAEAMALWTVHAHAFEASHITPRLVLLSPVMRCGKTTAMRIIGGLVPKKLMSANITPAATFRTIEQVRPTLLIDEADSFLKDNEEMRGIINCGHAFDGVVIRTVGDELEPRAFSAWCPLVLASIGRVAGTIEDRAIIVPMRRRKAGEKVVRLTPKDSDRLALLCRKAARWAQDNMVSLKEADPEISEELNDRAADNWRPLLAIADRAGGPWPERARKIAAMLNGESVQEDKSISVQLLSDIRDIFRAASMDKIASGDLCMRLSMLEGKPWAEWYHGRAMSQTQLARQLAAYEIKSKDIRSHENKVVKGYEAKQFEDAFSRYLSFQPQQPLQD